MNTYIVHFTLKGHWIPFAEVIRSDENNLKLFQTVVQDRIDALGVRVSGKEALLDRIFFVKQLGLLTNAQYSETISSSQPRS